MTASEKSGGGAAQAKPAPQAKGKPLDSLDGQELLIVDSLITVHWPKARNGDEKAAAAVMKLMEMRIKLKEIAREEWVRGVGRRALPKKSEG